MRVHVVDQAVFASSPPKSSAMVTDYRYARQSGGSASLRAAEIDDDLAGRCVALTAGLGLAFAGIDLRIGPDGRLPALKSIPRQPIPFTRRIQASRSLAWAAI